MNIKDIKNDGDLNLQKLAMDVRLRKLIFEETNVMKQSTIKKICLTAFLGMLLNLTYAQDLIVTLTNSSTESFPVSDIQSIKFGQETMILNELDGTVNTWDIDNIDNYAFDGVANLDETTTITTDELNIFPNPTTDKITINYSSNQSGKINIAVYDINGRIVDEVFTGEHNEETEISWSAKQNQTVQSGKYLIKITTESKIITKPVIVQ